jgi:hypothetical protein
MPSTKIFFISCSWLLVMSLTPGCHGNQAEFKAAYDSFKFDQTIIDRLPLYDSLVIAIQKKLPLFRQLNGNDSNQIFRFMPGSPEPEVFKRLPGDAGTDIDKLFARLGKEMVYGFDAYNDSSVKIYVRNRKVDSISVQFEEKLSYYPEGRTMKKREFPSKDTVLNKHWQYWVSVDESGLF